MPVIAFAELIGNDATIDDAYAVTLDSERVIGGGDQAMSGYAIRSINTRI